MSTCDTCKNWGWSSAPESTEELPIKECTANHWKVKEEGIYIPSETFMTGPKFGCVHHEPHD